MASDYIKNIIFDEKNNKIIADIADGNISPLTFMKHKELYSHLDSYEEKYGTFIKDLISGSLRCIDSSNKLSKLEISRALKNYYDDYRILGAVSVYQKYKDVIYQILYKDLKNDKQEVIPSELDLHYKMETLSNRSYQDINKIFRSLEIITENNKFSIEEKKSKYIELLNSLLNKDEINKPIFTLYRKENPNIIVSVYPSLEKYTYKENVFLSYFFDIKNIKSNFEKIYSHNGMMISYILDDEIRTKQILHGMEQQFIEEETEELNKFQEETEDLGEKE